MVKQYLVLGDQGLATNQQRNLFINLMNIAAYMRLSTGAVYFYGPGLNLSVYMNDVDFAEFQTNYKTAQRLKSAYE